MRRAQTLSLAFSILLSFFLLPQNALVSAESSPESTQPSSSLVLRLWTDKDTYYRQENISTTAQFLHGETQISNASITTEVVFPNNTIWFVRADTTDENGTSTFQFLIPSEVPLGQYTIYATGFKPELGNASATTTFSILPSIHDLAIINVKPYPLSVTIGANVYINITVKNKGDFNETFTVKAYANDTEVGHANGSLNSGESHTYSIIWTTASSGLFEIKGEVPPVVNETNTADNVFIDETVTVQKLSSTISISVSPISIKLGEPTMISGEIIPTRADVPVTVYYRPSDGVWTILKTVLTDTESKYSHDWTPIETGTYELKAGWEGDANTAPAESDIKTLEVQPMLPPTGTLTVTTTPVAGEVLVNGTSWGVSPQSRIVEVGTYNISFGSVTGYYTPGWQLVTVQKGIETTVTGVYEPIIGAIDGTVTDASMGLPIAGATVTADGYSATTDSTGYYIITDVPAGTYTVTAEATGYYSDTNTGIVVEPGVTTHVNFTLSLIVGWIDGYVTDTSTGAALVGATVIADGVNATTDAGGYYDIKIVPGTYTVTASMTGYMDGAAAGVVVTAGETTTMNFTLTRIPETGTISGTVTDVSTGDPIAGATVSVDTTYSASTDSSGVYTIDNVPPGDYTVTASASGYVDKSKTATVTAGETTVVNFALAVPGVVAEEITEPELVNATNPFIVNATKEAATYLSISEISDPVTIVVRNITEPVDIEPPPGTWKVLGNYVQIIVNNTNISVNATIRIYYTLEELHEAGLDESSLRIHYWNATSREWIQVESHVNTQEHYVWANINHLSLWAIIGQAPAPPPTPLWWLWIAIAVLVAVAIVAAVYTRRRKTLSLQEHKK